MEFGLFIYFRACEKQETISYVKRFKDTSKTTILKKCWLSLQKSIDKSDTVIVVHDSVSISTLDWLRNNCNTDSIEFVEVSLHDWSYHQHTVTLVNTLKDKCEQHPMEIHYIVEDDYLHVENAVRVMQDTLATWPNFAVSYDYPDRYKEPKPCHVVIGKDRHWRTVDSSTMTVAALGRRWLDIMPELEQAAPTSNDKVFELIYKQIPCISPMPGLASHMTDYHLTPLVDWNHLWERYDV
jgi:hypothetical protein